MNSIDDVGRTPLFYAAACGQLEALKFISNKYPSEIMLGDFHGDTALHAATSMGHEQCAQFILEKTIETPSSFPHHLVNTKNKKGMTAVHLASTESCLEVLYNFGADLAMQDNDFRSPLFVTCAMNRSLCAEFIIGCLDQLDVSLLLKDARGDTPLHAAACNGSVECLLLLLQYGIDPRLQNDKGLSAIELSIQNNHIRCKEILAEYHLHYCTSSEFDSVLFLATLEVYSATLTKIFAFFFLPYLTL
jgi:ankyrin repeat protein